MIYNPLSPKAGLVLLTCILLRDFGKAGLPQTPPPLLKRQPIRRFSYIIPRYRH